MEQEYHSELFDIRRVSENDKELFREVAKAEYLFGRLYDVEPDIGLQVPRVGNYNRETISRARIW